MDEGVPLQPEELHNLLTSGIACLPHAVSLIEVQHGPSVTDLQSNSTASPYSTDTTAINDVGPAKHSPLQPSVGAQTVYRLGRLLYANPALEQMSGYTLQELHTHGLSVLFGPATNPADISTLAEAFTLRHGSTVKLACHRRGSTASTWSRIHVTPINQLPFRSVAWLPAASPSCPSPIRGETFSRASSKDLHTARTQGVCGREALNQSHLPMSGPSSNTAGPQQPNDQQIASLIDAMNRLGNMGSMQPSGPGPLHSSGSSTNSLSGMATAAGGHRSGVVHFLCVHEDISSRVNEEMSWRLRDHALSSCSEGITIADPRQPDAPLIYVNDAFCQITGYSREEVLGRNCRFLQGKDTSRQAVATLRSAVAAQRKATVELLNYNKNGEPFWNRLSITPVFNDTGEMVSYIGVQSDVTELFRRKEEEQKLLEAKVAAENATEAKSMFLANMSHEIRTPLNGMMATAQLLLSSSLSPEQRELAETILESGNSLLSILGDILDFSKLDHGSIKLTREPVCLRKAIESSIEIVAPDAMKKGLTLYYTSDAEAMSMALMGDSIRLRQVLTNLLSNAVKFTEHGEVHVDVKVEQLPPSLAGPMKLTGATSDGHTISPATSLAVPSFSSIPQAALAAGTPSSSSIAATTPRAVSAPAGKEQSITLPTRTALSEKLDDPFFPAQSSSLTAKPTPGLLPQVPSHPCLVSAATDEDSECWEDAEEHSYTRKNSFPENEPVELRPPMSSFETDLITPSVATNSSARPSNESFLADQLRDKTSQRRVHISVRDTGIGIPANLIGSLFQCFKQGSESMARRYGGTGLGLAISKRLSELMQGTVWVESGGRGTGCTFHFCVPADFQAPPQEGMPAISENITAIADAPSSEALTPIRISTEESQAGSNQALLSTGDELPVLQPLSPIADENDNSWCGMMQPETPPQGAPSYASSTSSTTNSAQPVASSINVSMGQFQVLQPEEHLALERRTVLIDISHPGIAQQVFQSCKHLGMQPALGTACGSSNNPSDTGLSLANTSISNQGMPQADILVVSTDTAAAALRAGWKGRPVVAVGPRERITPNLYPLLVMLPYPVLHQRLANALVKSTVMLRWRPGRKTQGPKLTHQPISQAQIEDFKSWRERGTGGSLSAALLHPNNHRLSPTLLRGQYVGGQLAISNAAAAAANSTSSNGSDSGFPGGFMRPYGIDHDATTRRSSLDNSSLERALVQQMIAATQARAAGGMLVPGSSSSRSSSNSNSDGSTPRQVGLEASGSWRHHHHHNPMQLPQAIPENTVLQEDLESMQSASRTQSEILPPRLNPNPLLPQQPTNQTTYPSSQHQSSKSASQQQPQPQSHEQQPLRILIAEDNKVNQKVVLKVLQQIAGGMVADVVENGLEVLRALERKSYDIILMDIHMPEMDGLEATRRIVATYPVMCRPRIIALSADTLQALHDRCREAGIEEFIVKPFRVEDLKRVMQTCSRSSNAGGAPHLPKSQQQSPTPQASNGNGSGSSNINSVIHPVIAN